MNVLVLGTGAQGSIIAKRLSELPAVKGLICADYSIETANRFIPFGWSPKAVSGDRSNC
jgi:saccharopine dehydrogenase-like NADP-dependent oxidoreductase